MPGHTCDTKAPTPFKHEYVVRKWILVLREKGGFLSLLVLQPNKVDFFSPKFEIVSEPVTPKD